MLTLSILLLARLLVMLQLVSSSPIPPWSPIQSSSSPAIIRNLRSSVADDCVVPLAFGLPPLLPIWGFYVVSPSSMQSAGRRSDGASIDVVVVRWGQFGSAGCRLPARCPVIYFFFFV
ncbi:unnamed protein product [Linum trigynum]|uniref:Secreted peptide n=1 Tax=Linum trigynum TaxID=586398 RepID=A0AAV2CVV8_9ROSI